MASTIAFTVLVTTLLLGGLMFLVGSWRAEFGPGGHYNAGIADALQSWGLWQMGISVLLISGFLMALWL